MLATPEILAEAAQPHRVAAALPGLLERVPMYRNAVRTGASDSCRSLGLDHFPFITKADIRAGFPANFLPDGTKLQDLLDDEEVELEHTSGTSETRTALLLRRGWWAEQEARALRLNPFVSAILERDPNARRLNLSSPACNGDVCFTGVPSRAERTLGTTLFGSLSKLPFLWGDKDLGRIAAEAAGWKPVFLDADPVYATVFALYCERLGLRLPTLQFISCSYEFLSVVHRRILERVFRVPVFDLYGSTETGHLLMEVERGELRASLDTAHLEVLEIDEAGVGELVVTSLSNDFMPLVRYRIGDLVEVRKDPYQTRYIVHGRKADAIQRPGGRRVTIWQLDQCFSKSEGIAHYQVLQTARDEFRVRYVPQAVSPPSAGCLDALEQCLASLLDGRISLEPTDLLMPESSGKFRLVYPS